MNVNEIKYVRNASYAADVLFQSKWSVHILCAMRSGPVRLGQLGRLIPGASKKMLAQSLRKLEGSGIVVRKDMSEFVLHVEYELVSDVQVSIGKLMDNLSAWGAAFLEREDETVRQRGEEPK